MRQFGNLCRVNKLFLKLTLFESDNLTANFDSLVSQLLLIIPAQVDFSLLEFVAKSGIKNLSFLQKLSSKHPSVH
jgi:hypothetical protein